MNRLHVHVSVDPQGVVWETFHSLDAIPVFGGDSHAEKSEAACCG